MSTINHNLAASIPHNSHTDNSSTSASMRQPVKHTYTHTHTHTHTHTLTQRLRKAQSYWCYERGHKLTQYQHKHINSNTKHLKIN
jgi:hypothetical protein